MKNSGSYRGKSSHRHHRHHHHHHHNQSTTSKSSSKKHSSGNIDPSSIHEAEGRSGLYHSQDIALSSRQHHNKSHHHHGHKHRRMKSSSSSSDSDVDVKVPELSQSAQLPRRNASTENLVDHFLHHEAEVLGDFVKNKGDSVIDDATVLVNNLMSEFSKVSSGLRRPNVLLTGITGAGKSSLINAIFGKEIAKTGAGVPITQHFTKYASEDMRIVIYDSKGLEHGHFEDFIDTTNDFFDAHQIGTHGESADAIHVVWYVMNSAHSRFEPFEQRICKELFNRAPVIFLLNKADISTQEDRDNIRQIIDEMKLPNCVGIFDVMAAPTIKYRSVDVCGKCGSDDLVIRKRFGIIKCMECNSSDSIIVDDGLGNIIESTVKVLPEVVRDAFVSAQNVSFGVKEQSSSRVLMEFWDEFPNVRTRSKLMKVVAKMMARLSIVWEFKRHGHLYGTTVAKDLVSILNWKDQMNLLLQKKMQTQRLHTCALGILWNRCLRDLAICLFNNWSKAPDFLVGDKVSNVCNSLFQSCFSQFNEENLLLIENELVTSDGDVKTVLDQESTFKDSKGLIGSNASLRVDN
jgi:ribosome biogenesis GTPase A